VLLDQTDRRRGIEPRRRQQDARGAEREEGQQAVDAADVEQRLPGEPDVVGAGAHLADPALRGGDQVAVGQQRALRPSRRARRVTQQRGIFRAHVGLLGRPAFRDRGLVGRPRLQLDGVVGEALGTRADDQCGGAGVLEDVRDLVRRQPEVDRHRARAEPVAGEQRLGELEPVVQEQRDAVARPDAGAGEPRGEARGAVVQLGVGPRNPAEHERGPVGVGVATAGEQLGQHQAHVLRTVHALTPGAP
jgi:hypothetical protein